MVKISDFLSKEFIKWAMIGVLAVIIHYGIYLLLNLYIQKDIAFTIGYLISFCCNFYLNSVYTYHKKPSFKKGIGFGVSHVINYLLQIGFFNLFIWLGVSEEYAPIPMYVVTMPINLLLVRFVFKTNKI
ncbi:MAG: GtrA family protein [Parabacteroides sp.]|nr:GtrA family protein [Parabacteroides sp.]